MLPSATELVARFLRAHNYTQTLQTFIQEASLPTDVGTTPEDCTTIEKILQEKKTFDVSLNFERLGVDDHGHGWTAESPSKPHITSLPSQSNIISVTVCNLSLPFATRPRPYIAVTTADRHLYLLDPSTPALKSVHSYSSSLDSPVLDVISIGFRYLLVASMSGKLLLYDTLLSRSVDECKHHSKYLVKLAFWENDGSILVASAGWDAKIFLYRLDMGADNLRLGEPVAKIDLQSIPETIVSIISEEGIPILLVARRDSTFLHYYSLPSDDSPGLTLIGRQNLSPNSNSWVAFSPADVKASPQDQYQVAIVTSGTPSIKLLMVRLLLPAQHVVTRRAGSAPDPNHMDASTLQEAASASANREEAAILVNVTTRVAQTPYSTPRLTWRPDASGVFISSDDGIVRGFEAGTGKLVASLEGHEPGSKVRCLAGHMSKNDGDSVRSTDQEEYLISGAFDRRLILWSPN